MPNRERRCRSAPVPGGPFALSGRPRCGGSDPLLATPVGGAQSDIIAITMEPVFCLVADILGFRRFVTGQVGPAQASIVDAWVELVDRTCASAGIDRYQLISDTLFVATGQDASGLETVLCVASDLVSGSMQLDMPLRGGIARGSLRWSSRITHGPAIVSAYEFGERLDWCGVACEFVFPEMHDLWSWDRAVLYEAPVKGSTPLQVPCVAWNVPPEAEVREHLSRTSNTLPFAALPAGVAVKLRNTAKFGRYLKRFQGNVPPDRYHGD